MSTSTSMSIPTKRSFALRVSIAVLSLLLGPACLGMNGGGEPGLSSRFVVKVNCQTQEGRAVSGVLLQSPQGSQRTDARGTAELLFDGKEGDEVFFRVERAPQGLEISDAKPMRRVVLKRYGGEVGMSGASTVSHDITFRNKKDTFVVLVYADQATNLPILANGKPAARLNSRGAAAFRYEAKPGEELVVTVATQGDPRASLQDPKKTFKLTESDSLLLFHTELQVQDKLPPPPIIKKKREHEIKGPKPIPINWGKMSRR